MAPRNGRPADFATLHPDPKLETELARLEPLDLAGLRAAWSRRYNADPPIRRSRDVLMRLLAWHMQEEVYGGLPSETLRQLRRLAGAFDRDPDHRLSSAARLSSGTQLVRDWRGTRHVVQVREDGFEYEGARYQTFSEIARRITGTRWSGRRVAARRLAHNDRRSAPTVRGDYDRALLLTGFAAALRRSELAGLDRADVVIGPEGMVILVQFPKTDRTGLGAILAVPRAREADLCAVAALERWLARRGDRPGPLFHSLARGGAIRFARLSDKAVVRTIKAAATSAGRDPALYAGHSLRAGFATSADRADIQLHRIARQTRHGSLQTLRAYLRETNSWRGYPWPR